MSNTAEMERAVERFGEQHPVTFGIFACVCMLIPVGALVGLFWISSWVAHFLIRG
jgi:membrane protein YdbS with pleckstrin-like domain